MRSRRDIDSAGIGRAQQDHERDSFRVAVRALLMTPLMDSAHEGFPAVRRHGEALRDWFSREAGWTLQVERDVARLHKRPAELTDATRGLPGYDRRRYVLLCLVCAVLERADAQITLRLLGERLLTLAADPTLAAQGFGLTLDTQAERRELVTVCRTLMDLGVIRQVAGDEQAFVQVAGEQGDALYDVHRRILAGMLSAVRGPSTWTPENAPATPEARLHALVEEHVADDEEGRRMALRHRLARRLLDDPVVYLDTLDGEARAYFVNQRGAMAARLCEGAGLMPEQRAEGLALVDQNGVLTDVAILPAGGIARSQLAAETLGDAHALDQGRPVASLVLAVWRSVPAAADEEPDPDGTMPAGRVAQPQERTREVWAQAGVLVNELARPALFLNLPSSDGTATGEPAYASLRRLVRSPPAWDVAGRCVHVCENPNLVAIAADRLGRDCLPLVCTDGMPAAAQRCLLSQLVRAGAELAYHGDFDWPGLRIGNHVMRRFGARPWRYGARDYAAAVRQASGSPHPLAGDPVDASWDGELTPTMRDTGISVAEEASASMLLRDLAPPITSRNNRILKAPP